MNIQQLETIGKEVARQVAAETGVDSISLFTFIGIDGQPLGLGGLIALGEYEQMYSLNSRQVDALLSDPEPSAREFLERYLTYQVRWFCYPENVPSAG
jgi:hypothetical protein